MNEISHQQARFLIRRAADRRLPEEQWAALQAHLEGCDACRAYQARLGALQKSMRRVLRERWRLVDSPPAADLGRTLPGARRKRQARRSKTFYAALGVLAFILLAVFWQPGARSLPPPEATQPAALTVPTPTPTPLPGERFQGLVAFESRRTGDGEIFLLNAAGSERDLVNLTQHPGEDSHPAWSPDGEWLAFLSERAAVAPDETKEGKRELFVISVAGSSLTQITADPDIAWEGPLEWAPDGKWIRLIGRRRLQNDDPWVYLVPLDGSRPLSMPGTRGISSTELPMDFGWGYLPYDPFLVLNNWLQDQTEFDGKRLRSLAPHPENPVIAALQETSDGAECAALHLFFSTAQNEARLTEASQLCVAGVLQRANWAPNRSWDSGSWLVLAARAVDAGLDAADSPGIYALKVPYLLSAAQPWPQERLADLEPGEQPALAVRPLGESLGINPVAVADPGPTASLPPESAASPPPDLPAHLLLVEREPGPGERSAIVQVRPDGSQRRILLKATSANTCPAWSPDHTRIAFLSDRTTRGVERGPDELFVLDVDSGEINQLTRMAFSGRAADSFEQGFGCPVWSPDGQYLATVSQVGQGSAVMVFNESGQVLRNAPVSRPADHAALVWAPDGQSIIIAQPAQRSSAPRIARVPWRQPVASLTLLNLQGADDIHALSISPDGKQMAFIYARYGTVVYSPEGSLEAHLRVVSLADMEILYDRELPNYDLRMLPAQGRIEWLQGGQLAFAIPQGPLDRYKALLLRYDPAEDTLQELALVEDTLYDWAINGAWLVYSSESGLWGVPVDGRLDPPRAPLRLSDTPATGLHWR